MVDDAVESGQPPEPSWAARWLGRLGLLLASLVVGLLLVEAILRWVDFQYQPFAVSKTRLGNQPLTLAVENESFIFDRELLWKPRPGVGVFNAQGLRGEVIEADDDRFRVLVIGDSNTLGWIYGSGANWPSFLADLVGSDEVVLVNGSSWGWSSFQGVRRLLETQDLKPDLVIFGFGANDAHQRNTTDREFADRIGRFATWPSWRCRDLMLALFDVFDRFRPVRSRVPLDAFESNLREANRLANAAGAALAFTTRPFLEASSNKKEWSFHVRDYNDTTRRVGADLGVPVIDHAAWAAGRCHFFTDNSHFTEFGHRAAGQAAYRAIQHLLPVAAPGDGREVVLERDPDQAGFHLNDTFPLWSTGDAIFNRAELWPRPGDRLVVEMRGWHPWIHQPERLWLQARANGELLELCSRDPNRATFRLTDPSTPIDVVRVTSATFVASDYFDASDTRRLGLDIVRVGLEPAAGNPCS